MIVIDTSVAIKWLRSDEENYEAAIRLYRLHIENTEEILIPTFLYIEAANALATNSRLSDGDVVKGMQLLYDANLKEQNITQEILREASSYAKNIKHQSTI